MACNETYVVPRIMGFDFEPIFATTWAIYNTCSSDPRLYPSNYPRLTCKACQAITGEAALWLRSSWTAYPGSDIWTRLASWKFPLLQLLFQFPRPPLGWKEDTFVLFHLFGDPIDTIANLLNSLEHCQSRAETFGALCNDLPPELRGTQDKRWKALTLLAVSLDECGRSEKATELRQKWESYKELPPEAIADIIDCHDDAANALAADRATRFLPILLAQSIFMGAFSIAFAKSCSEEPGRGNWVNVEAHSIGFSALYFWVIPAVFLASMIGTSQSELAIPRILTRFNRDMEILDGATEILTSPDPASEDGGALLRYRSYLSRNDTAMINPSVPDRILNGGMYSWQPSRQRPFCRPSSTNPQPSKGRPILFSIMSLAIVACGLATGLAIGFRVPPEGSWCRPLSHLSIFLTWLISYLANFPLSCLSLRSCMRATFVKDVIAAFLTVIAIVITQWGVLNRCSCWSRGGENPLVLPQEPAVAAVLTARMKSEFVYVIVGGIVLELLLTGLIALYFQKALRVYLQRDDDMSNIVYLRDCRLARRRPRKSGSGMVRPRLREHMEIGRTPELAMFIEIASR